MDSPWQEPEFDALPNDYPYDTLLSFVGTPRILLDSPSHHSPHSSNTQSPFEQITQTANPSANTSPEQGPQLSQYHDPQPSKTPATVSPVIASHAGWSSYACNGATYTSTAYGYSGHVPAICPNPVSAMVLHSEISQQHVSNEYSGSQSCPQYAPFQQTTNAIGHLLEADSSISKFPSDVASFTDIAGSSSINIPTIDISPDTLLSQSLPCSIKNNECLYGTLSSDPTGVYSPRSVTTATVMSANVGLSPPYSSYESGSGHPGEAVLTTSISTTVAQPPCLHIPPLGNESSPGATQTLRLSQSCAPAPTPAAPSSDGQLICSNPVQKGRKRNRYIMEDDARKVPMRDNTGAVTGYQQVFGIPSKQRQPYSPKKRADVAHTRRLGACDRCRSYKMKCGRPDSPYELCIRCMMSNLQTLRMPCFLAKPVEAELFRDKPCINHPLQTSRSEVYRLLDIEVPQREYLRLELTQDFGETLVIYVTRFEPRSDDKTAHPWKDKQGRSRSMEMPPYCIARMGDARNNMLQYIDNFRGSFLSSFLRGSNEITGDIFDEARRHSAFNPTCTVRKALDLFAANRIIERDWRICGAETLGMGVVDDPENPWFEKIPVTPIMDLQLDQIVIQSFLKPLRDPLLQELQVKIYEARKENWFEIFLTISILLTNAERLLQHSRNNAKRYGVQRRYNSLDLAYSYFHACKILIAHFRFVCAGFVPLSLNWRSQKASTMANLDADQTRFMESIQTKIKQKEEYVLSLKANHKYESELYWCHQLFFEKWDPGKPWIEDESE